MWNRPQLMTAVSDLLVVAAAAALLVSAVVWIARLPLFPIHEVLVTNELHEVRRSDLEETLSGRLRGNFFSVNLEGIRQAVEQLQYAQRETDGNFYEQSVVDARLRELRALQAEEEKLKREGG